MIPNQIKITEAGSRDWKCLPIPRQPLFDGAAQVEYLGQRVEFALTAMWTAAALRADGLDVGLRVVQACGLNPRLPTYQRPATVIQLHELCNGTRTLSPDDLARFSGREPWTGWFPDEEATLALLAAPSASRASSSDVTRVLGACSKTVHAHGDISAWMALRENRQANVVTDWAVAARLALACGRRVLYIGGPTPKHRWWPAFTSDHDGRLTWIVTTDTRRTGIRVIKRCPCRQPETDCHALQMDDALTPCSDWTRNGVTPQQVTRWIQKAQA